MRVPNIGGFKDVGVIEVLVKPGEAVAADASLVTLESDKATMDVPSPFAGTVREVRVKVGDRVGEGTLVLLLEAEASDRPGGRARCTAGRCTRCRPRAGAPHPSRLRSLVRARFRPVPSGQAHASPCGPEGGPRAGRGPLPGHRQRTRAAGSSRRTCRSSSSRRWPARFRAAVGLDLLPWPKVDFARFGPVETRPLSRIRKIAGANLARNWVMIPHVTQFDEADVTDLEDFRVKLNAELGDKGPKVTLLAFLVKACVAALKRFPDFNSSLDGDSLVLKRYFHVGFAADTPNGLVVPVVRDADRKGVLEIARELGELSARAREGKLAAADIQGGTFSISSLGGIGGTAFTPIVNAPEVAILGASRVSVRPVWDGERFAPRMILPLSLSYDHRVVDGAAGARFTTYLAELLRDMRRAML